MPEEGKQKNKNNSTILALCLTALAALGAFAFIIIETNSSGQFAIKYKDSELNFTIDENDLTFETLIKKITDHKRLQYIKSFLETKGIMYNFGSEDLLGKIRSTTPDKKFSKELRKLLLDDEGPFSCCHSFIDKNNGSTAEEITSLPYDAPLAQLLREKARRKIGIFRDPGQKISVGFVHNLPETVAASCRKAEHFRETVELNYKNEYIEVDVQLPIDCDVDGFAWRDTPSKFIQISFKDARKLFGSRALDKTELANIIVKGRAEETN